MFNERGFYKSNGFSFDEQEIINDFNGNLMYNIPLYNFALAGDINFNLSMNYNGSVGHQFFLNNEASYQASPHRYSMNAAEWIINLNGIAVQTLNFETNFFTTPRNSNFPIKDDSVRLLIPGYHFDGPLWPPTINGPDKILVLAGDGSVITLENKYSDTSYTGTYAYEGKDLHYQAQVSYIENSFYGYSRRKLELMKGDGAIYEFIEYKRNFADLPVNSDVVNTRRKPMMFLLQKVSDEYGHNISISYDTLVPTDSVRYGRPLIDSIKAIGYSKDPIIINFAMGFSTSVPSIKIINSSQVNGDYWFIYKTPVTYFTDYNGVYNHRAYIDRLRNPLVQFDSLRYESYERRFNQLPSGDVIQGSADVLTTLYRMSYFRNTLKKRTSYTYTSTTEPILTYYETDRVLKSSGNNYKGYGRDLFYTNMLASKTDFDNLTPAFSSFIFSKSS